VVIAATEKLFSTNHEDVILVESLECGGECHPTGLINNSNIYFLFIYFWREREREVYFC